MRTSEGLADARSKPAKNVKDEESQSSQSILNVISKDPEIQHVSYQVKPSSVEEHRCENGKISPTVLKLTREICGQQPVRDHSVVGDKLVYVLPNG